MGIGKTLMDVLNEKNENANSLATKIGVTPSTIYSIIDRDNMRIDIGILAKICQVLDTPMERFYNEYIQESFKLQENTSPQKFYENDEKKSQLMKNYELLNNEGQQDLVEYSDMLASNPRKIKEDTKTVLKNA